MAHPKKIILNKLTYLITVTKNWPSLKGQLKATNLVSESETEMLDSLPDDRSRFSAMYELVITRPDWPNKLVRCLENSNNKELGVEIKRLIHQSPLLEVTSAVLQIPLLSNKTRRLKTRIQQQEVLGGMNQATATPYDTWFHEITAEGFLGSGSFGIVVQSKDPSQSPESTAVKLMFPIFSVDEVQRMEEQEGMSPEFDLLHGKSHDNVVKNLQYLYKEFSSAEILNFFRISAVDYPTNVLEEIEKYANRAKRNNGIWGICIQMELCGTSLRTWLNDPMKIRKIGVPDMERVKFGQGLISGVQFLHANGILHRDLKPENIYFSVPAFNVQYNLPIKIGDFGLSREIEGDVSQSCTVDKGTRLYRAPEVNSEKYGKQADLFSLGLILFEMFESIPYAHLSKYFHRLVYDKEVGLVSENVFVTNLGPLIIGLTKRRKSERIKPGENIDIVFQPESSSDDCDSYELC